MVSAGTAQGTQDAHAQANAGTADAAAAEASGAVRSDAALDARNAFGLLGTLGITILPGGNEHEVKATMRVTDALLQAFGVLHGGATCALLETVAGVAAGHYADPQRDRVFGVELHFRHRRPGLKGHLITGVATFDRIEGNKYYYDVATYDEDGTLLTEGWVMNKIVSQAYLASRNPAAARETHAPIGAA